MSSVLFYSLVDRADLPSFPTRRSSDLIGAAVLDAVGEPRHIGDKEIVADELARLANQIGQLLPAIHVVFRHAVLDRDDRVRSEEHTSELQSHSDLVCRLLLEKKKRTSN